MTLRHGLEDEYEKRHNPIWPELQKVLKEHGVHNYSIFLDRNSSKLFAYAEIESDELWSKIAQTAVCQRWWSYMRDLMFTNSDDSPVTEVLDEVFHLD